MGGIYPTGRIEAGDAITFDCDIPDSIKHDFNFALSGGVGLDLITAAEYISTFPKLSAVYAGRVGPTGFKSYVGGRLGGAVFGHAGITVLGQLYSRSHIPDETLICPEIGGAYFGGVNIMYCRDVNPKNGHTDSVVVNAMIGF